MPAYSEQEIIAGCRKKNRAFQEYLYKTQYSMLLKICARYAKDMQDAEQLLNDGFLKIFTQIGGFKEQGSFEGWMKRIMINTSLDYLRSNMKGSMVMNVNTVAPEDAPGVSVGNYGMENMEFKELVSLIQSLPAMTRTVFNLYVFDGFNHKEIADQLKISDGTSHWHLHQARALLQDKIKKNSVQKSAV